MTIETSKPDGEVWDFAIILPADGSEPIKIDLRLMNENEDEEQRA